VLVDQNHAVHQQYGNIAMLKIDASFGERKNGIRTQDFLNASQTLFATTSDAGRSKLLS